MKNILLKEFRLSASPLAFIFIIAGFMFFLPGYPVLVGAFFVTLGLFHSFQSAREANDIVFSVLLPIAKKDVVKGKYLFVCFIEGAAALVMTVATIIRMTLLKDSPAYRTNALMNANLFALGVALLIFGLFNAVFVGGFFKTAFKQGKPFVIYIVVTFLVIAMAEALHYFPGLGAVNAFGTEYPGLQLVLLFAGIILFVIITLLAYHKACRDFERVDL